MSWFKVDDSFSSHPKVKRIPRSARKGAVALWTLVGSHCSMHLTDGFLLADDVLDNGGAPKEADQLVTVRLWHAHGHDCDRCPPVPEGQYLYHDWLDYNPSREKVLAERKSGAARQKVARSPELREFVRLRDGDRCRYCGNVVRWNDRRGALGGTYDHVIPNGPSDVDNLVVCCRGCNASKGARTPEQAGMVLRPSHVSRSDLSPTPRSDLGSPRPPTRPDPTPSSSYVGTEGGGSVPREPQTHPAHKPSGNCPDHPRGTTDPCGACGRAKGDLAAWDAEERRLKSLAVSQRAREDAQLRRLARDNCQLCNDAGYRLAQDGTVGTLVCDHIYREPNPLARARASVAQPESRTA